MKKDKIIQFMCIPDTHTMIALSENGNIYTLIDNNWELLARSPKFVSRESM